ncbi:MAG: hypothetical protein AVDCRST_MAG40-2241, partial [uncultured Gemmatimonadaceae bacterium]
ASARPSAVRGPTVDPAHPAATRLTAVATTRGGSRA